MMVSPARPSRRLVSFAAIVALFALLLSPASLTGQGRNRKKNAQQNADQARQAEDNLESLLRRFGPKYEGLAAKIDAAIAKGVAWLMTQQSADGHFACYDGASSGYPMGGTAICLLAIKKSMVGLYQGSARELKREIRKLEGLRRRNRIKPEQARRLNYISKQGKDDIEQRKKYEQALKRGMTWLRSQYESLASPNIPPAQPGQPAQRIQGATDRYRTYGIGVTLMLLEGYYTNKQEVKGEYILRIDPRKLNPADLEWARKMVAWLVMKEKENQDKSNPFSGQVDGVWRYPGAAQDGSLVDGSNSQYAALGLKAASRMFAAARQRLTVPEKTWRDVIDYYLRYQDQDGPVVKQKPLAQDPTNGEYFFPNTYKGEPVVYKARGWSYLPKRDAQHPTTGAMTTAALAALITAKSELYSLRVLPRDKRLEDKLDRSINDGLAWLGKYFSVTTNPTAAGNYGWHLYYLYGLERVGILSGSEFIGENPWYPEGAKYLVGAQKADGSWGPDMPVQPGTTQQGVTMADTAFALLFLKRATTPVNVPLKIPKPVITEKGN